MKPVRLIGYYFFWHYGPAYLDIFGVSRNLLWFLYNFFSIPLLLSTLFWPLERIRESYPDGLELQSLLESVIFNTIMRVIGFIMRSVVIVIGVLTLTATLVAELVFFILWTILPIGVISLFIAGIMIL